MGRIGTGHSRGLPSARTVLAGLLAAMAVGQASDLDGFEASLAGYRVVPGALLGPSARLLVVAEAVAAVALIRRWRGGEVLGLTVAGLWTVAGVEAFARGLSLRNCGCFGTQLAQPLRWWVLVEDAEFVALATWVLVQARRRRAEVTAARAA
jgi:Methylamine utilisation protein MauE